MRPSLALLALAFVALPCAARAEESVAPTHESPVTVAESPKTTSHWYGWQPLAIDAVAAGALVTTTQLGYHDAYTMIGPTVYAFGAPTVHALHGRWGASMGSLALRVALPWALFVIPPRGCANDNTDWDQSCQMNGRVIQAFAGAALASVIDVALFSWEQKPVPKVMPFANVTSTSATLGLSGVFG